MSTRLSRRDAFLLCLLTLIWGINWPIMLKVDRPNSRSLPPGGTVPYTSLATDFVDQTRRGR